jgi:threonine aldolase
MKMIDLRSDTVTLPTEEMRDAMRNAELGDDVFREDPTINRLQEMSAELMGKEAALLVSSGTMGNLVCVLTHCERGEEVIIGDKSHMFLNECGSMSAVGGVHPHTVMNQTDGTIRLEDIKAAIRGDNDHWPRTRLICLENTHNRCYGAPLRPEYVSSVCEMAHERGLPVHLDGARIFNAMVALDVDIKDLVSDVDSLSFCLSKGLSAPVGSVVCGTRAFIAEARRNRKLLGGGMRQAGIVAAPGIVALGKMVKRLAEDHQNARRLAKGIASIPGLSIDPEKVYTNIVYFEIESGRINTDELVAMLADKGILTLSTGPRRFRMVTHYGVGSDDIEQTLKVLKAVMGQEV